MKTLAIAITAIILVFGMTTDAGQVNGNLTFSGTVNFNTTSAGTATAVTAWHFAGNSGSPYVSAADGDFAATLGTSTTFAMPWSFVSGPLPGFWKVGGFTFDLTESSITSQGFDTHHNGYVFVSGTGLVSGNGFRPTFGTWSFTTQDPSAGGRRPVFSFSASTAAAAVPEGGATLGLLGFALVGVEAIRRRLIARRPNF